MGFLFLFFKDIFWAFCLYWIGDSRLTGKGERDGGRHAANVVGLGSRTRDAARLHRAYGMRSTT